MTHVRHFQQQRNVWSIATGNLLYLSEQQLVNCSRSIPFVTAISRTMDLFSPMEVSRGTEAYPQTASRLRCRQWHSNTTQPRDFFVEVKKPSEKATKGLYQTLSLFAKAIENLAKGNMMWPVGEVKLLSDQVLDSVVVDEACGGHASFEQHFTDAPWKMALFTQAITQTRKIDVVLATMEKSVSEGNNREWSSEWKFPSRDVWTTHCRVLQE